MNYYKKMKMDFLGNQMRKNDMKSTKILVTFCGESDGTNLLKDLLDLYHTDRNLDEIVLS
jgi:hypothetical protein